MAVIDNLESAWELDEANGNALDSHGSNDLTDTNTVGTNGSGWRDFEADNTEYFTRNDNASLSVSDIDFTLEIWINIESLGTFRFPLSKDDTSSSREYGFYYDTAAGGTMKFYVSADGSALVEVGSNLGAPNTATEYQFVMWHDAANNQIAIRHNDVSTNTQAHSAGVFDGTAPFQIGAVNGAFPFDGLIRRVRLWKKVLSAGEITWLYNSGNGRSYSDIQTEAGSSPRRRPRGRLLMGVG